MGQEGLIPGGTRDPPNTAELLPGILSHRKAQAESSGSPGPMGRGQDSRCCSWLTSSARSALALSVSGKPEALGTGFHRSQEGKEIREAGERRSTRHYRGETEA